MAAMLPPGFTAFAFAKPEPMVVSAARAGNFDEMRNAWAADPAAASEQDQVFPSLPLNPRSLFHHHCMQSQSTPVAHPPWTNFRKFSRSCAPAPCSLGRQRFT